VERIKTFLDQHQIRAYTEHLSYCSDDGHLYDLMPIPFTDEAVDYVAAHVRRVQEILERRIALENVSYYAAPGQEMREIEFIKAVLEEADCDLLLEGVPVVSPLAWSLSYRFAVHRIGPAFQPQVPEGEPTQLVVYRNREERVEFLKVNAVTQRLLERLRDGGRTGREALETIAAELRHRRADQLIEAGRSLLADLHARAILLGTARGETHADTPSAHEARWSRR